MAITVPLAEDLGRLGSDTEATFKGSLDTALVDHGGLMALDASPDVTRIQKSVLRNSAGDGFADIPGTQSFSLDVEILVTDLLTSKFGPWLKNSIGEEVAADSLTGFTSGTTGQVVKTNDAHVYDDIIKVPGVDGFPYFVPVKTKTATTATFAHLIASAANAAPKNASQTGGKAYRDAVTGAVKTFRLVHDQCGRTGEIWIAAKGAVCTRPFDVVWNPGQLLRLKFHWEAASWVGTRLSDSSSGLADVADNTEDYISDSVEFGLQDMSTPAALAGLTLKSLTMSCGYGMDPRTGSIAVSGGTIPESPIYGWARRNSGVDVIQCTVGDGNWRTYHDLLVAKTALSFWVSAAPGTPSSSAGSSRFCHWRPRVKIVGVQKNQKVNGELCTGLTLMTERQSGYKREYTSFFGTS